jgi:hypothetical protein
MEERRATPRRRIFKAGSIEFDGNGVRLHDPQHVTSGERRST